MNPEIIQKDSLTNGQYPRGAIIVEEIGECF